MALVTFLLGLGLGILINDLADTLPPDELGFTLAAGPARCRYCGGAATAWRRSALLSFLLRGGRCEHCGAQRRWRPVGVELLTGVSLAGLWVWTGDRFSEFLAAGGAAFVFILIAVIDIEHRLILWRVAFPAAAALGLLQCINRSPEKTLVGGLVGYGLVLGLFLLGQLFSVGVAKWRGEPLDEIAFGGGDVNLAALIGLTVGWPEILLALLLAIFSAGIFSLGYIAIQLARRRYNPYTPIPYGPFLILGAAVVYLWGRDFAAWYLATH